ncbi:MAG: insulinase family protein [Prevotella sp.]|jgi:predicted Zn-dependent peptidase|uniref:M16 family metallopeptidase n=1 Tax=Prevotella sp. TaxID=59823 RepID=UPI0025E10AD2|nr:pitrilysin family protein [Prevotella sp.]MBD9300681.1 insulinase family protein [Prevotella sp.]
MKYNTYTLDNGLRIIHLPSDSKVVYCGYQINAGTRDEEPGEEGLAHFCEHVTFKGTERRKAWHILNCLESVGGDLNAYTNKEGTVYYAAILKEHIARAVDLLSDIVFHSTYPQQEIDKEVEVICDEIESYNDSPAELIYDEFENILFKGNSLGHNILGTAEQVRQFTTEDALRFTRKLYRPDNAVFFAYGDIDFKKLVTLLKRSVGSEELRVKNEEFNSREEERMKGEESNSPKGQTIVMEKHTHQAHVMIGTQAYDVHDDRRMPLYLLNNILGGPGMNAKLNLALREHNGLVYTVESTMVAYGDTGTWSIYFGCDEHDVKRCLRLVRKELDKFMEKPLSDAQLRAAKKQIKGQIGVACDNRENFALDFGKSFLHYGWEKNVDRLYEQVDAITAQQMQAVAQELFDEHRLTTLIFK